MPGRLEHYLDELSQPLPACERKEWRAEAESHLSALIAAYEELGHSHEEATELALAKFGEAQPLARQMQTEAEKSHAMPPAMTAVMTLFALQGAMCWSITLPRFITTGIINEALLLWGGGALFIALGLLKRREFWRKTALVSACLTLLLTIPFTLTVENWVLDVWFPLAVWRVLVYCIAPMWQLWVLTRPSTRALFLKAKPQPQPRRAG